MATILVVEDYPVTQRVLSLQLRKAGHQAIIAANGLDALNILDDTVVDLVLLDIAMPEMDGITLLSHLRGDSRFAKLSVIMLSASGQDRDWAICRELGVNEFLSKPTSSSELIDAVNRALAQSRLVQD